MSINKSSDAIQLSPRLAKIKELVPKNCCTADIGTDHAYIPISLVKEGIAECAIASDIKKGPLLRAKANIQRCGLSDKIEMRLGAGLSTLKQNEAEVIIIAGMGGILISEILEKSKDVAKGAKLLILQPMTAVLELREYLVENGYFVESEYLEAEEEKIYNIIAAKPNGRCEYSLKELYLGKDLEKTSPELFPLYKSGVITKLRRRAEGLKNSENILNKKRLAETEDIINILKEENK